MKAFSSNLAVLAIAIVVALVASFHLVESVVASSCQFTFSFNVLDVTTPPKGALVSLSDVASFVFSFNTNNIMNQNSLIFRSADFFIHSNNTRITEAYFFDFTSNDTFGFDTWGKFSEQKVRFSLSSSATSPDFGFSVKGYFSAFNQSAAGDKIVFRQEFYSDFFGTQNNQKKDLLGDSQEMSTSFPAFHTYNPTRTKDDPVMNFYHFAGFMSGSMYPSSGNTGSLAASEHLYGGIRNASVITFFTDSVSATFSPASEFIAASLEGFTSENGTTGKTRQIRWGINGNAASIPAGYSVEWVAKCSAVGSVNTNMRAWGKDLLQRYEKSATNAHDRDITLQTLGYSTDNGAGGYYLTFPMQNPLDPKETFKSYQDYFAAVKKYSLDNSIPYHWAELDSWWYYRGGKGPWGLTNGLLNWSARPDIFPDGLAHLHNTTQWYFQLHNRYFAPNNVYASNPLSPIGPTEYQGKKFPFVFSKQTGNGVPGTADFWEYFFAFNEDKGVSYIQDWISFVFDQVEELTSNVTFGLDWLKGMANGADVSDWSIQYCMSYPRAVLASVMFRSVTQARASNDYQPETLLTDFYQWRIGDSSLFAESIGLAPAKDNFWTSSVPQYTPHYDPIFKTRETRNRLESLVASMSNSIVAIGDALGFSDRELIMRSCNCEGLLLRPSQAATPLDSWFFYKATKQFSQHTPKQMPRNNIVDPVQHFTVSNLNGGEIRYFYLLSVNNGPNAVPSVTFSDLLQSGNSIGNGIPSYFLAWEANSSGSVSAVVNSSYPLVLNQNSDELSFQYFTLVPVYPWMFETTLSSSSTFVVLLGEAEKWITASEHRIKRISYSGGSVLKVHVVGGVGEIVSLVFGFVSKTNPGSKVGTLRVNCKIEQEQTVIFNVDNSNRKGSCEYF